MDVEELKQRLTGKIVNANLRKKKITVFELLLLRAYKFKNRE